MLAPPLFRPVASKGKPHKAHDLCFSRFTAVEGRERHWETIRARYRRSLPLFCYSSFPVHSLKVGGALAVLFISTTFMVYFLNRGVLPRGTGGFRRSTNLHCSTLEILGPRVWRFQNKESTSQDEKRKERLKGRVWGLGQL